MKSNDLKTKFPNASPTFIRLNSTDDQQGVSADVKRIRPLHSQPDGFMPLDGQSSGEEACWYGSARRFEIRFVVYSMRPADYDGWDIKALQDFLHKIGIIPDDGWKTLFGGTRSEKVSTEGEERTEIEIRPC